MNFIKKILTNFLLTVVDAGLIEEKINLIKINACRNEVTIAPSSMFYKQATVFNFQHDKLKIEIGSNTHIRGELLVFASGGRITIGDNCYIGEGTRIWSGENIRIGNNVLISHNVNIMDTNSHEIDSTQRAKTYIDIIKSGHASEKGNIETGSVEIHDNAWINFNVSILKGVKIGKGAIVAAGSIVTKDVDSYCVVAGIPAKLIKKLTPLN